MWPWPKKKLIISDKSIPVPDAFLFPEPLKYSVLKCKDEVFKHTVEITYKNNKKEKFTLFDTSSEYSQFYTLEPREFTVLKNKYCGTSKWDKETYEAVMKKAKALYDFSYKLVSINRIDSTIYQHFAQFETYSFPVNGNLSDMKIIRSGDIKEVRVRRTLDKTIEYDYISVQRD